MEKRGKRQAASRQKKGLFYLNNVLCVIFLGLAAYLIYLMSSHQVLNLAVILALLLVLALHLLLSFARRGLFIGTLVLILASILTGGGIVFVNTLGQVTAKINQTARVSQVDLSVVVAANSPLTDIGQVSNLLAPANDATNVATLLDHIQTNKGLTLTTTEVASYQAAYEGILADPNKAMVLSSAHASLLESVDPDFSQKIKTIYTTSVEKEIPVQEKETIDNSDAFNVYISGIDSYGPISGVSRSDVNILMTINRKTHKVLLTTTPRDSYVSISGGGNGQYDKLTHAGIYGVDASIGTLENLYGIDITHYARLNFTSFLQLIDLVGGVEVYNDQEFTQDGVYFPAGQLSLDSERALRFVRERYGLQGGDNDRGQNQLKVVTALIKKLASFQSLSNYQALVEGLSDSVQTDFSLSELMTLATDQLSSGGQYQVTSQTLTGSGSTGQLPSYAMPGYALYMFSIDEGSLAQAKANIQAVMEGN